MKDFHKSLKNINSSPEYEDINKMARLLKDHFSVNHFWYYKTTNEGMFSYFGTNHGWNEYGIQNDLVKYSPNIRHPSTQPLGINFINASASPESEGILNTAWEKFKINFNLNLTTKVNNGIESFGFATNFRDSSVDQHLLNNISLLQNFIKVLKERNKNFFELVDENAIDVGKKFGPMFYNRPKILSLETDRAEFMRRLGYEEILKLTPRETDVMKLLVYGYPAAFIADQLCLSKKTVENYLASIKDKLFCGTKVELIQKARDFQETGYFS